MMPMCIMSSSMCIRCWSSMCIMSSSSTNLMELNTIRGIFIFPIEPYMREIIPNRKCYCTHNIREKELIEHKKYPEWNNTIFMGHHISKYSRWMNHILIISSITKPRKYSSNWKYICLFYHIKNNCSSRIQEEHCYKEILENIDSLVGCLRDNKTTMKWK